jgi:E1A/CREB-binding protein
MTENSSESIDNTKLSNSAIPNADQIQSGGFYPQNQQVGQQESHVPSSNGYNSNSLSATAQSYNMQYNPHNQQGTMSHNGMVSGPYMQQMHPHGMTGGDSYMHMQGASSVPQQYMAHSNPNPSNGNPGMVNNTGISNPMTHPSHISQAQNYNHMSAQMQIPNQQDPSLIGSHLQGSNQAIPSGPYVPMVSRGMNPYMGQPMHGMPQQQGQNHNANMNMQNVQNQAPMYSMQGQTPAMYNSNSQLAVNPVSAPHPQMGSSSQPNPSVVGTGGLTRSQQPKMWHHADHQAERLSISENIVNLLKSRRPNAAENWTEKLPQMAKKLEDALYHEADSFEEYRDRGTLKTRLQRLAIQMGNGRQGAARAMGQTNIGANQVPVSARPSNPPNVAGGQPQIPVSSSSGPGQNMNMPALNNQYSATGQYPVQSQMVNSGGSNYMQQNAYPGQNRLPGSQTAYSHIPNPMMHNQQMVMPGQQNPHNYMTGVSGMDYNRSMGMQSQSMPGTTQYAMNPDMNQNPQYGGSMSAVPHGMMMQTPNPGNNFQPMDNGSTGMMAQNQYMYQMGANGAPLAGTTMMQVPAGVARKGPIPGAPQGMPSGQPPMLNNPTVNAPPSNSDEHRKQVLKQQQQRLLLLRHASKCPHENNRCPVTPHCWGMKQLWKHIMSCKDQDCKVPHCVSSRYVLSHYSKCKEPQCPVCGPVRDAIKKNYERSKEVVGIVANPVGRSAPPQAPPPPTEGKANHPAPQVEEPAKKKRKTNDSQGGKNTTLVIRPPPPPVPAPKRVYPLDPISSAIYTFDTHQIESHIKSIQEGLRVKVAKIKEICKPLIDELYKMQYVQDIFGTPVDHVALGLPDYPEKVKCPMDLGTVSKKMDSGSYRDFEQMAADVRLTFDNAMIYNPVGSEIHRIAKNARKEFNDKFVKKIADFERKISEDRQNNDACTICGEIKLEFAPPVLYCSGTCARAIKRGSWYYSNNAGTYFWCPPCFNSLKASEPIHLPDCTIPKSELEKNRKQHNEVHPESWVECDGGCGRWVHQICSLFNSRRNVQDLPFVCPLCVRDKKIAEPNNNNIVMPVMKPMKACDLPRTVLSDFLEKRIQKRLEIAYEEIAAIQNVHLDKVEKCPTLTLRQVSCIDKEQDVREGFLSRYKDKTYPTSFPCRVKCLVLFQNIDGQDVILFGMYVYEYGHNCPEPNRRRVYVSYLDSVHYLRPKQYRTLVYHEILISYLDYVKARGFHTAHIWACPPQKGDDYILHIHPIDQKTPRPQTLKVWYEQMLKRCVERGIVVEMQDLHTEYLTEANNDATLLPYFEGDYWVNEAEVIIKNLTEGKKGANAVIDDNAGQAKRKSKSKRAETKDVSSSNSSKLERDPLLAKLSGIIEPMKDTFFVARLHPKEYAESFHIQSQSTAAVAEAGAENEQTDALNRDDVGMPTIPEDSADTKEVAVAAAQTNGEVLPQQEIGGGTMDVDTASDAGSEDSFAAQAQAISLDPERAQDSSVPEAKEDETNDSGAPVDSSVIDESGNEEVTVKTEGEVAVALREVIVSRLIMCGEDMPVLPDNTEDVDEPQQNEHFETRQSFLNLCQGNHYQFDQLRRAKHSSMMVLYHLHNPDAPKFVPTCSNCKENIVAQAFHCRSCEIDFCQSCVAQQGSRIHVHPLQQVGSAPQIVTEEQRKERERSIKLHMQLLSHAANCGGCESKNCARMKEFLNHESVCDKKVAGGCRICSRMSNLLHLHARQCKVENCKVPHCISLREQFRKLQMSQMQMDDRRRQQMNLEYNRGTQKSRGDEDDD